MCGRFALTPTAAGLTEALILETERGVETERTTGPERLAHWKPSWNIAPTDTVPVLFASSRGQSNRRLELARWGLIPSWAKTLKTKASTFNARAEDLTTKPMWRGPVKSHRAIVPASGYYEWHTDEHGTKRPFFIHLPGSDLIGLAGLYSWWRDPASPAAGEDPWVLTFTVLTSDAVDELVGIHDRNPVPLPRKLWNWWTDPTISGDQEMVDNAVTAALPVAEQLHAYPVAPIRSSTVDGPQLIQPATP